MIVEESSIGLPTADGPSHDVKHGFLVVGCVCPISASETSTDIVLFVNILERCEAYQPYTDSYRFTAAKVQVFFSGKYLEQVGETRHKTSF